MDKKFIKVEIPTEVYEEGGCRPQFVEGETIPLDGAINDAVAGDYVLGNPLLIRQTFFGLMQSMADGVRRDGHARQIGDFITVYPVFKGPVDLEKGFDPEKNSVMIRARLLNEMEIDITDWSFVDVTPGKRSFRLTTVKAGDVDGEIVVGAAVEINGKDVPNVEAGEPCAVSWRLIDGTKSGDVASEKIEGNISRIDLAEGALVGLGAGDDGKEIEFTVRGNFSNAKIKGAVKVIPAPTMTVNGATSCSTPWTIHGASTTGMFHMTGENIIFTDAEDEGVWFTYEDDDGETVVKHATPDKVHQSTTPGAAPYVFDRDFVGGDGSPDHKYVGTLKIASRAGVPGSILQVFEHECAWDVD